MSYPAVQLINRAWYLSGIVGRQFETVSGQQGSDGLWLLNELLSMKSADIKHIPYYRIYDFTLVAGQELYFLENVVDIETFTFFLNTVRYPTSRAHRVQYFGSGRANNILSLPFQWNFERVKGGGNLRLYFRPQQNYGAQISAKFALTSVGLYTDLSLTYDDFYISYLRYLLAEFMCQEYNVTFAADKKQKLMEMEEVLAWVSPPDLTLKVAPLIGNSAGINYAQANLGRGFTVP